MENKLVQPGANRPRVLNFISGVGMASASLLTIRHFFLANYPESIFEGSFCDLSAFFNCDSSAFSVISQVFGIPLGFFGLIAGLLVILSALFPTESFVKTNAFISLLNLLGIIGLLFYSILVLGSLCLLCTGYYIFSFLSFAIFWRFSGERGIIRRYSHPSLKILAAVAGITILSAYGIIQIHNLKKQTQVVVSLKMVKQFYELPEVGNPVFISPYWTAQSTDIFEDAPIQVVEYSDFICPDCVFLTQQLNRLKEEFAGKINIAYQFFPLEGKCNDVVEKDLHSGACELAYIAAHDPAQFLAIHDEIFANFNIARSDPEWRRDLAVRYGVEAAFDDPATQEIVRSIINTGMSYNQTSNRFAHGIRSTPTMIINGRMLIGTLPYEHMRTIFQALADEHERGKSFMETWVPPKQRQINR